MIGLSVPYRGRGPVRPTTVMPQTEVALFYQLYFQTPGVAEAELERDPKTTSVVCCTRRPAMRRAARAVRSRLDPVSAWWIGRAACSEA